MPELLLPDIPPRLLDELREWATLRRYRVEAAAIEMIRIGLYETRDQESRAAGAKGFTVHLR